MILRPSLSLPSTTIIYNSYYGQTMFIIVTTRLVVILLLLSSDGWLCAGSQTTTVRTSGLTVTVTDNLNVIRGRLTTLEGTLYSIDYNNTLNNETVVHCTVLTTKGHYCGVIYPSNIDCNSTTQQFFQHYGCLNPYETINLRVEILTDTNRLYAKVFSISVHILPNDHFSSLLITHDSQRHNKNTLTFLFPSSFTNKCSFTVTDYIPNIKPYCSSTNEPSPISGPLSRSFPCGYSPKIPFSYNTSTNLMMDTTLVVRTLCHSTDKAITSYHIVPLSKRNTTRIEQLSTCYLHISEMSESIVSPTLFSSPINKLTVATQSSYLKFVFPVEYTGGLYSIHSYNRGSLTATTFTLTELKDNSIVFRPNENSIASYLATVTLFHYYVLDWSGLPVAEGILHVKLSPRTGLFPSIRKNTGIVIERGQSGVLTSNQLDFYPPLGCFNYTITMVTVPLQGMLLLAKGNMKPLQVNQIISISGKNLNIVYKHNQTNPNSTTAVMDKSLLSIKCNGLPDSNMTVAVPFIITAKSPSVAILSTHCSISVVTYVGTSTPLRVHLNESCRLSGLVAVDTLPRSGNFISVPSWCSVNTYPFVVSNQLKSCPDITNITINGTTSEWGSLWYVAPLSYTSMYPLQVKLHSLIGNNWYVTLQIKILDSFDFDAIKTNQSRSRSLNHSFPIIPYVSTNLPLPLHSPVTPVYITSQFLYVYSLGYLQKDIIYHITKYPQHGLLCVLYDKDCHESVRSFTQEDVHAKRVYYKPFDNITSPLSIQDSFQFQVFYLGHQKIPGIHTFRILHHPGNDELPLSPWKQFWVLSGREKPLAKKHLRHFQRYFKTKRLTFTVLKGPHYGIIKRSRFTWNDLNARRITYRHTPSIPTCRDMMTLKVTTHDQRSIVTNFTIAVKNSTRRILRIHSIGHKVDSEKSFVLSSGDFHLESNFCFEFIKFTVTSIPAYGLLRFHDDQLSGTIIQLAPNSTFTGRDIIDGRLTYQIFPDLVFFHESQDNFELYLEDPQGPSKRQSRSVSTSIFYIYINELEIERTINLTIVSPKIISKLDTNRYGGVFERNDMYLSADSDFVPPEVLFRVRRAPAFGKIQKNRAPVNEFSLDDVYNRKISYISILHHNDTNITSDEFEFSVYLKIERTTRLYARSVKFVIEWCYFAISSANNRTVRVDENMSSVALTISIIGADITVPANVSVVTIEQSGNEIATEGNCTSLQPSPEGADYCHVNTRLMFVPSPYTKKDSVRVPILDDSKAEGLERFVVGLRDPQTCFVPVHSDVSVFIADYGDTPYIKFSRNHNQEHPNLINFKNVCPIQYSVQETTSTINITLTRTGNLNQTNAIICYTKSPSSESNNDYIHRPNNSSSLVYFNPGQVYANCTVIIINDGQNEPREHFFVTLGEVKLGYAFIDYSSSPVCVFINHDVADVPFVSFEMTQIIVRERRDRNVNASFKVLRAGTDLNRETNLLCQILPNSGNATGGVDYSLSFTDKIVFSNGQTEAEGKIEIMADREMEGTEVFYVLMTQPYNGRINDSGRVMEVVIIDALESMFIGFSYPSLTVKETILFAEVPLQRQGDLTTVTNVTCILHPGTAGLNDYIGSHQTVVVFPINSTKNTCGVVIYDDDIREGNETLTVTIVTSDPYVKITEGGTAVITIEDPEDAPIVQFKETLVYTSEPLSNNLIDYKEVIIPLEKSLGPNVNASILYRTINNDTTSMSYVPSEGRIVFPVGTHNQTLSVQVLANHSSFLDKEFYIELLANEGSDTKIGVRNVTKVIVRNTPLKGVYFPTKPMIKSFLNDTQVLLDGVYYYDLPLVCLTSCDHHQPLTTNNNHLIKSECNSQDIDLSNTIYTWWASDDGYNFVKLQLDTLFTSTSSQVLEAVYLSPGKWIKCTTVAVDGRGIKGYSRTSDAIRLSNKTFGNYDCTTSEMGCEVKSEFLTYEGFQGSNKDMIQLSITIPSTVANTIPILTTKRPQFPIVSLLTYPVARSLHPCSSLTQSGHPVSFISQQPLTMMTSRRCYNSDLFYRHYDTINSRWIFKLWLPLKDLVHTCRAHFTPSPLELSMSLYVSLATINNGRAVLMNQSQYITTLNHLSLSPPQSNTLTTVFPFNYYPISPVNSTDLYFSLLSLQKLQGTRTIRLVGHSYLKKLNYKIRTLRLLSEEHSQLVLPVYTDTISDEGSSNSVCGWVIDLNMADKGMTLKINLTLQFELCSSDVVNSGSVTRHSSSGGSFCVLYDFMIPFHVGEERMKMSLNLIMKAKTISTAVVNRSKMAVNNMTGLHILQVSISPDPSFIMKPLYMLNVTSVYLCTHYTATNQCRQNGTIVLMDNNSQNKNSLSDSIVQRLSSSHLLLYFNLDNLLDALTSTLQGSWYIGINYNLQYIGSHQEGIISNGSTVTPLPMLPLTTSTISTVIASTNVSGLIAQQPTLPTYAFILILLTVVILVSVASITGVLLVCMIKQKWVLKKELLKESEAANETYTKNTMTRRHYNATIVPVVTTARRPSSRHHKRYSTSSSSSSLHSLRKSAHNDTHSILSSNTTNTNTNTTNTIPIQLQPLRRSRSLPTIPSSREQSPSSSSISSFAQEETTGSILGDHVSRVTPFTSSSSSTPVRTSTHLISELQSLPKKERTNVLIATVKPLTNHQTVHHDSTTTTNCTGNGMKPPPVSTTSGLLNKSIPLDILSIKKALLARNNTNNNTSYKPQGVGWYERRQARQKALDLYSQIYLAPSTTTDNDHCQVSRKEQTSNC